MKFVKTPFLAAMIVFFACGVVNASEPFEARGSAVATGMFCRYLQSPQVQSSLIISNMAGSPVTCKVTVYDHDGNDVTSLCDVLTGSTTNSAVVVTQGGTFELPAFATRSVRFINKNVPGFYYGQAVIEWTSNDPRLRKALHAKLILLKEDGSRTGYAMSSVNGDQPF